MKLTCGDCGRNYLVQGSHYWRNPSKIKAKGCPGCYSSNINPDETGEREIESRNREVNTGLTEREQLLEAIV